MGDYLLDYAFYVKALGLFPFYGQGRYIPGTPRCRKAVLHQPGGDLTIIRTGGDSIYPVAVSFNGRELPEFEISASELRYGGTLLFMRDKDGQ